MNWNMLQHFSWAMVTAQIRQGVVGSYLPDGQWAQSYGPPAPIVIVTPQPLTGNLLQMLEKGERVQDYRVTWSKEFIKTRFLTEGADLIDYDGQTYEIHQIDDRIVIGGFYRAILRRVTPDEF